MGIKSSNKNLHKASQVKNKDRLREYKTNWKIAHNQATYILPRVKEISKELSRLMKNVKVRKKD